MNYTTEQVIDLYNQYLDNKIIYLQTFKDINDPEEKYTSFPVWLKDKEQSELPVKDQIIWVTDVINDERQWVQAEFIQFHPEFNSKIQAKYNNHILNWDEYSLTDPNK